tara:strand:+ start:27049 stop:27612 length:564 start_codon:yes stop_codon:yes gene_type:complete
MFVKYTMTGPEDYRGSVKLVYGDMAYSSVEVLGDDMTELDQTEIDFVKEKTDGVWLTMREYYLSEIDRISDEVRVSHMEVGFRSIDIEYRQVEEAIREWEEAGSPTTEGSVPLEIQVWADVKGETVSWAVNDIKVEMGRLKEFVRQLRAARLVAKAEIRTAATADVVSTFENHKAIIEGMRNTDPQY